MIKFEDRCVHCGLPCLGLSCPNMNVKIYECDNCNDEVETLYEYDGMELCTYCLLKEFETVR